MIKKYPKPANWQDFQRLCTALYTKKYNVEFQEYGTIGSRQLGVDIRGTQRGANGLTAIQCKDYSKQLTKKLIRHEYSEAEKYNSTVGKISQYVIATTNSSTTSFEPLINELSSSGPFPITIEFWDNLNSWINNFSSIVHEIYPELIVKINQEGDTSGKFFYLHLPKEGTVLEFVVSKIPIYDGQYSNQIIVSNPREKKCVTYDRMNGWYRLREVFEEKLDAFAVASFINSFPNVDDLLRQQNISDTFFLDPEETAKYGLL
jgi:hypothetical protein